VPRCTRNQRTIQRLIALGRQAIQDNAVRVAQRLHAIILSLEGHTTTEIAALLKVHRSTVPLWIEQYNREREGGLLEGHRSGRPSLLTPRQRQQLQDILDSGPVAYGLDTGVWTSPIIGEIIA
jgi:transposase